MIMVAFLLVNSLVLESNEVIATSGFVSHLGIEHIVWVWALDMGVVMLTAALYSVIVDRTNRIVLTIRLFSLFSVLYLAFFLLFQVEGVAWLAYPLLTILNDQQWSLFGLLIWHETLNLPQILGAIISIVGILMIVYFKK